MDSWDQGEHRLHPALRIPRIVVITSNEPCVTPSFNKARETWVEILSSSRYESWLPWAKEEQDYQDLMLPADPQAHGGKN